MASLMWATFSPCGISTSRKVEPSTNTTLVWYLLVLVFVLLVATLPTTQPCLKMMPTSKECWLQLVCLPSTLVHIKMAKAQRNLADPTTDTLWEMLLFIVFVNTGSLPAPPNRSSLPTTALVEGVSDVSLTPTFLSSEACLAMCKVWTPNAVTRPNNGLPSLTLVTDIPVTNASDLCVATDEEESITHTFHLTPPWRALAVEDTGEVAAITASAAHSAVRLTHQKNISTSL